MSDSVFNAAQFLGTTTEDVGEAKYYPIPVGEYKGQIEKVDAKQIISKRDGEKFIILELVWIILDEEAKKATEQETPRARQSIFLDLTTQGGLDFGKNKNVPLSKLREAVGQNRQGRAWAPPHLMGCQATVMVAHDVNEETGEVRAVIRTVTGA